MQRKRASNSPAVAPNMALREEPARYIPTASTPDEASTAKRVEYRALQGGAGVDGSTLADRRIVHHGDNPEQTRKLPEIQSAP